MNILPTITNPVLNLPKEIFRAQADLSEKLMKLSVETAVSQSVNPEHKLDIYC
ncbi:MAG: hypothetical protein O9301_02435 [Leptospira sp.]|nr:hypothetical protein [Leptospira sp.]